MKSSSNFGIHGAEAARWFNIICAEKEIMCPI
jgi:hypothetical protein